jgi:pimeloyl-ACP methyl ester carboxylesterase
MTIIDRGSGTPLVVVPGIQGRWEYGAPAIDALARHFRVVTFSLCGERGCPPVARARGIENYADQIAAALDARGIERAVVCGVSFGGVAALRFAGSHPERTLALVLVSTPGPGWHLKKRHQIYARLPWLFGPVFLAETPRRLRREVAAAIPSRAGRLRFAWGQLRAALRAPVTFSRMAERAEIMGGVDFAGEAARVSAPTLVVSGDPALDHVVPTEGTSQYARLIRGARAVRLEGTGHLGSITRPDLFAATLSRFVEDARGGTGLSGQGRDDAA